MAEYFVYIDADYYYHLGFVCEADTWQGAYDTAVAKTPEEQPTVVIVPFGGGVIFVGTPDRVQELKDRA